MLFRSLVLAAPAAAAPQAGDTLRVKATAYGGHQRTATGGYAKRGICAVDPDVIPLGTRFRVPGYGVCLAADVGGAVRGAMIDALRATDWAPRSVHRNTRAVSAALAAVEHRTGREARDAEIAAELNVSLNVYHRMVQDAAQCRWERLDELESLDPVDGREDPLRELADSGLRTALTSAIEALPERERLVMSLYYGDEMNLKEIGAVLGVSESRISQLHGQAVARLRARLAAWRDR